MTDLAAAMRANSIGLTIEHWAAETNTLRWSIAAGLRITPQRLCDIIYGRRELTESMVRDLPDGLRQRVAEIMIRRHLGAIAQLKRDGGIEKDT